MEGLGAATIPTVKIDKISQDRVLRAMQELRTDKVVIKPDIGGAAWRQALYKKGDPFPNADELPPQGAMIQAYLKNVEEEGEYSFLYFGGKFSHALLKRPQDGDYRVQSIYGGTEQVYDPTKTTYEAMAKLFFETHDPSQINRQGPDVGTQYRTGVFYLNDEQKNVA